MNYLLVAQSLVKYSELEEYCMPLGIAYINGAMRAKGFAVDAINMLFEEQPLDALYHRIQERQIDVLMCGGLTSEYRVLRQIYATARAANPNIILVGGGGGFTSEPMVFSELTGVDYAVIGEGEITNCELAYALDHHLPVTDIKGLVYKTDTGYRQTEPRPYIQEIDTIPFPSYEGLAMDKYLEHQNVDGWYNYYAYYSDRPRMMPMMMARSCPFQCSFCFHPIGSGYRYRSLDNFFQELDQWVALYHINGIALVDECFSIDQSRVIAFCERIKPYHLAWACQMRAETYTDKVLRAMKDSGCIGACFGIESMSQTVLANMNKHMDQKTIEHALTLTYQHRVGCTGNLIFGAETETLSTIAESLSWHRQHAQRHHNRPVRQFAYIQTYPGSIYYKNALKNGKIPDKYKFISDSNWDLNITALSNEEYEAIGDIIRLCRRETYNRGKILNIAPDSRGKVDFTFQCAYCGEVNTYHGMNPARFSEGKIKRLGCRHCNMLGDYVLDEETFLYDEYLAIPWFLDQVSIPVPEDFFAARHWRRIGICGRNAFSKKLIGKLQSIGGLEVLFIYDVRPKPSIHYGVPQLSGEDPFPEVDLIINADLSYWKTMEKTIAPRYSGPVIYMETLLRQWYENNQSDSEKAEV